jgi:hypothetical protein
MGMGRPSPYGQQGSFFGGGFSPMFSPMMQSPMYGGPGKGRYPMQPQGMPGGPGKGRSQDPFGRQTMQPQPFGQVGNNPPPPPPQLEMVGNNPVGRLMPQPFQPAVDLSSKQRGGPRFGINMPPPPQATIGDYEYSKLLQGAIRQEPMTGNQNFGETGIPGAPTGGQDTSTDYSGYLDFYNNRNSQLKPVGNNPPQTYLRLDQGQGGFGTRPSFDQLRTQGPMNMPQSPFMGQQGQIFQGLGSFGQINPTGLEYPQPQPPAFGVQPFYRDRLARLEQPVRQGGFTQGPMNMPQPARIMDQGPRPIMDRSAMHLAPQLASNPRYRRGFYGGGIMDLYPR